jgi:CHAT domain-containing protein
VHLATHGEFSRKGGESYVLTYDGRLDMDDLQQFMSMTTFREQPIELLTLSACQTAAGDDRAALGLAGIAVKAGARSALATLWFINATPSSRTRACRR